MREPTVEIPAPSPRLYNCILYYMYMILGIRQAGLLVSGVLGERITPRTQQIPFTKAAVELRVLRLVC